MTRPLHLILALALPLAGACGDKDGGFAGGQDDEDSGGSGGDGADGADGADGTDGTDGTSDLVDQDGDGWYDYQDCDDTDPQSYPGAEEIAYDGIDQDCDGQDLLDFDQDGYDSADYGGTDCDDEDPSIHPDAEDVDNGIDDDCDGLLDEDIEIIPTDWPVRYGGADAVVSVQGVGSNGSGVIIAYGELDGRADFDATPSSREWLEAADGTPDLFVVGVNADRSWAWSAGIETDPTSSAEAAGLHVDLVGGITFTGTYTGTLDFDPGAPEYTRESFGDEDGFVSRYDPSGMLLWAASFGASGDDRAHDAAAGDPNLVVAGDFEDTADVYQALSMTTVGGGGTTLEPDATVETTAGRAALVAAWDPAGAVSWAVALSGSATTDVASALTVDTNAGLGADQRVYVAGTFQGDLDLDPGEGTTTASAAGTEAFLVALDGADGSLLWSVELDGAFEPRDLAVDATGSILVAGALSGSLSLGGATVSSAGGTDALAVIFDASGNYEGHTLVGGSGDDAFTGIDGDGSMGMLLTGSFSGTVSVAGATLTSQGGQDCLAAYVTSAGSVAQWAHGYGSASDEVCADLDNGGDGYVYFGGGLADWVDFSLTSTPELRRPDGLQDGWVHRLAL